MTEIMVWVWLGIFIAAFVIEASTQELVSIWFGVGSLVAMCISGVTQWWIQLIVFTVISFVALIATRPLIKKLTERTERFTNSDEQVGKFYKLIKSVSEFEAGEVKINGVIYQAILQEGQTNTIDSDTVVEVVAFKGNKVIVKEI